MLASRVALLGGTRQIVMPDLGAALIADFDPARADLLSLSGANVSSWTDAKGGVAVVQATSGFKPILNPVGINGLPSIDFDATDDFLRGAGAVPGAWPTGATAGELWLVVNQTVPASTTATKSIFDWGSNGTGGKRQVARAVVSGVNRLRVSNGDGTTATAANDTAVDFSGVHVIRVVFGATSSAVYMDGTLLFTLTVNQSTATTGYGPSGTAGGVPLGRAIITTALTADQAAAMWIYLKAKAGI